MPARKYTRLENQVSNLAVATRRANELTNRAMRTGHPQTVKAAIRANKNLLRMANNNFNNYVYRPLRLPKVQYSLMQLHSVPGIIPRLRSPPKGMARR